MGKEKILALLFMPFVLNLAFNRALWLLIPSNLWLDNPREAHIIFTSLLQTYGSPFMSLIQGVFGLYAVKSLKGVRNMYNKADLTRKSVFIIIGLVSLSWSLFMIEGPVNVMVQGISWEEYGSLWSESMKLTPLGSRLFTLIVGSLTAGVFEEIFWGAYGITMLEDKYGSRIALMLQAVAFGIWHVQPVHAVFATVIGVIYGYIFIKKRKLLTLSVAHWLTDITGFYFSMFP